MFDKLTVVDLSSVLAGPSVGTFFAELGAHVIKVEHPKHHDVTRTWKLPTENPDSEISAYFSSVNYKKDYLFLDLLNDHDHAILDELVRKADIVLMNFKKGDDIKLRITPDELQTLNPRLIIGKITGYGDDNDRVAYDLILQAESGFMSMNGTPESGPVKMPLAFIDILAGHQLKQGLLVALLERSQSNFGKVVSVSLYDAAVCSLSNQGSNYLMAGHVPQRIGSLHPNIAPYGEIFETKDKKLITFAIGSDTHFDKLCHILNCKELIVDERFKTNQQRVKNRTKLAELLQSYILTMDSNDLLRACSPAHVPAGMIRSLDEVFLDEEAKRLIREEVIQGILTKRVTSIAF